MGSRYFRTKNAYDGRDVWRCIDCGHDFDTEDLVKSHQCSTTSAPRPQPKSSVPISAPRVKIRLPPPSQQRLVCHKCGTMYYTGSPHTCVFVERSTMSKSEYTQFLNERLRILERERDYLKRNLNQYTKWELEQVEGGIRIVEELLASANPSTPTDNNPITVSPASPSPPAMDSSEQTARRVLAAEDIYRRRGNHSRGETRRTSDYYHNRRRHLRWSYVFLAMWVVLFFLGVPTLRSLSLLGLVSLSFFNALVLYVLVYAMSGIVRRRTASKVFAVFLMLLVVGFAYQNEATLAKTNLDTFRDLYLKEGLFVQSLANITSSTTTTTLQPGSTTSSVVISVTTSVSSLQLTIPTLNLSLPRVNLTLPTLTSVNTTLAAQLIFLQVNALRLKNGVPALQWNGQLALLATQHSQDMVNRNYFSHYTPEGLDPTARAQRMGIQTERCTANLCYEGVGENLSNVPINVNVIGCGYVSTTQDLVTCAMDGWISSPGHYANMTDQQYIQIGVGVACSSSECMLTQDFM